jgi:hypothetical protein
MIFTNEARTEHRRISPQERIITQELREQKENHFKRIILFFRCSSSGQSFLQFCST